jgi:membrane-associated protease RseP (regulator of RpoE activity)
MNSRNFRVAPVLAGACGAALLALVPNAALAADNTDRAELEKELAEARAELDKAAREVAEISRQLYGGESGDVMRFVHAGARGSMLGVNLGGGAPRDEGVDVAGVSPGGPAEQAGIRAGDVLVAVDGQVLKRSGERNPNQQLVEFMRGVEPGRAVKVDYLRDGKKRTATVTTAPAEPPIVRVLRERMIGPMGEGAPMPMPGFEGVFGPERAFPSLELVPVTPKLGAYFGTDKGLLVVRAPAGKGLPLEEGDVLQTIDGRTPESPGHAFRILHSYQPGEKVKLGVLRQRKALVLEATMPASEPMQRRIEKRILAVPATPPPAPLPAPAPAPRPAPAPGNHDST